MKCLDIIIPIHNEAEALRRLISELKAALASSPFSYNIIPVNDGSSDNTKSILDSLSIPYLLHKTKRGYGASIKHGINFSDGELICIIDADLAYSPHDIISLLKYIDGYDMVVGARTKKWSESSPFIYRASKFFICKLLGLVFNKKVYDINSGLRIMRRTVLNRYLHILPDGFSFTSTITFAMMLDGYKIKYVPINYYKRAGKSKIKRGSYTLNFINSYFRTLLNKFSYKKTPSACGGRGKGSYY